MSDRHEKDGAPAENTRPYVAIGTVLGGRYRLDVLLGSGAIGRVFRAEHTLLHKPVAVKVLNADHAKNPELVARFEREATAAANIEHPNVVAATDFGKLPDGTVYLALELVEGRNLRAEIAEGPFEARRALRIARQIAAGLAAAHARNIVHRDLKPENVILVEKDADRDFVKVLDFGVAKLEPEPGKSPLTKVGAVLGTVDYMAPEQALGQAVDARADLYALGAVMYEMLCGVRPYEGETSSAILGLQLTKPPPSLRERAPTLAVPGAVETLVMRLLAKERNARPASSAAVVAELDRLLASSPSAVPSPSPVAAAPRPAPSQRPAAPRNHPTFLPTDPLPAFTFPPLEAESKKLAAEVQQAVSTRAAPASSSASVDALLADPAPAPKEAARPAPVPVSSSPSVDALLAELPRAHGTERAAGEERKAASAGLAARVAQVFETLSLFVDDRRRFLPRFIKRPLRRVPSSALVLALLALIFCLLVTFTLLAFGSDDAPR
jgi:serine/threonine-protein kinase